MKDLKLNVDDAEDIVRLLSFPGCVCNGNVTPEAFSLYHKDEDYVSVLRTLFIEKESDIMSLGNRIRKWPVKDAKFCGYCQLNVAKIRMISNLIDVISCYEESFKSHAGIIFLDQAGNRIANSPTKVFPHHLHLLQLKLCYIVKHVTLI